MPESQGLIQVQLLNELMRCRDFQRMLDLVRPAFGNPLILSNGIHSVLAITRETEISDPNWREISESKGVPMGVASYGGINEAYRRSLDLRRPVLTGSLEEGGVSMLRKALAVGDSVLGYLDSPLYFGEPGEDRTELFDFLGNLIIVELQKSLGRVELPDNMLDFFVYDLLEGRLTDQNLIRERLDYFGWDLMSRGKVQVISIRGRQGDLAPDNTRFRRLTERFTAAFPQFKVFVYGSGLKMICPVAEPLETDGGLWSLLIRILEEESLVAGISRPLLLLDTIPAFNRQSERAVELGRKFHPEKTVHLYDSYAIYHALDGAVGEEDLYQFCHSAIAVLRDYDREHETELLRSLRVYLTHDRSVGESAAALYIHRNTMNYRIARIGELTKVDMNDPDVFCHLLFSFYALDYRRYLTGDDDGMIY